MSRAPDGVRFRILVVEDNPADVDLLRRALANAGLACELNVIDDGADALAVVRRTLKPEDAPDLAIIDLNLPKHGGLEIVEEMRSSRVFGEVPVVILSSSSSSRERETIVRLRVARQIVKPPDLDEFLKIGSDVRSVLVENRARRGTSA